MRWQRRPLDVERARLCQEHQGQGVGLPTRSTVQDHVAKWPERLQSFVEGGPANPVINSRHPIAARDLARALGETFVSEDLLRARVAGELRLLVSRRCRNDACADQFGDL